MDSPQVTGEILPLAMITLGERDYARGGALVERLSEWTSEYDDVRLSGGSAIPRSFLAGCCSAMNATPESGACFAASVCRRCDQKILGFSFAPAVADAIFCGPDEIAGKVNVPINPASETAR